MAKEIKKRYIKLNEKASSFSCPTTGVSIAPGKVIELTPTLRNSKKVQMALKGGHLEYADESEFEENQDEERSAGDGVSEEFLNIKTKAMLIPMALALLTDEDEEDEDDINAMKKAELVEFIILKNN